MAASLPAIIFIISILFNYSLAGDDSFSEELIIRPLPNGFVSSHFHFSLLWNVDALYGRKHDHYNLFPKSLGEILSKYQVRELHLSLSQGLWRHRDWGFPVEDAPSGVELYAWFHQWTEDVDSVWSQLTHSLSGLFCASLNFIDGSNSVSPQFSFKPRGVASSEYSSNSSRFLRYSVLPREVVCTENLTPWKKLLPCGAKAGLATLLNSAFLFNTNYHSLGVHVRPKCKTTSCKETALELTLTATFVSEIILKNWKSKQDWSLSRLFGASLITKCPLASKSYVFVDITANNSQGTFDLTPSPSKFITGSRSGDVKTYALYDMNEYETNEDNPLNIATSYSSSVTYTYIPPPPVHMQRFITGFGQESGGIKTQIYNSHHRKSQTVIYMEMIPWYFRIFLHTMKIKNGLKTIKPLRIHYIPSRDRYQSALLEVVFILPANSMTSFTIEFDRAMLKWTEYPPDANHGFYIGSAILSTQIESARNYSSLSQRESTIFASLNSTQSSYFLRIHSEQLLVSLPTPDFSMPYNVICLTCTVVAIAFGPLHNLTTKKLQIGPKKPNIFIRIKDAVKLLINRKKNVVDSDKKNS